MVNPYLTASKWSVLEEELGMWMRRFSDGYPLSATEHSCFIDFLRRLKVMMKRKAEEGLDLCAFCRNNGEPFEVYVSHKVGVAISVSFNPTTHSMCRYVIKMVSSRVPYSVSCPAHTARPPGMSLTP